MNASYQLSVVIIGLGFILLGILLTMHGVMLQNHHTKLWNITKIIKLTLSVGLIGAIANVVQNELVIMFGNNLYGFLVSGGTSAILIAYVEQTVDIIDKLPGKPRVVLGVILFVIGFITEILALYVALTTCG